ncbi:UNVERIFIED_CONTAM: hypothetical protein HHA_305470 [Hammondia hammondi]|eukprot:XP_008884813.1 hypothetical protein HHA_305470 [Hammondia hammondi]
MRDGPLGERLLPPLSSPECASGVHTPQRSVDACSEAPAFLRREFFGTSAARQRVLEQHRRRAKKFYGSRTIGETGSFVYLVNQIFGASLVAVPYVFKASGFVPCLLSNTFTCAVAAFAALMLLRAMTMIKGNYAFQQRVEYAACVAYFLGKKRAGLVQVSFYFAMQAMNVASIVVVSQAIDQLLILFGGYTAGLQVLDTPGFRLYDATEYAQYSGVYLSSAASAGAASSDSASPPLSFSITLGYLICACICIPLSTCSMEENMTVQYISFAFLLCSVFVMSLCAGLKLWGSTAPFQLLSTDVSPVSPSPLLDPGPVAPFAAFSPPRISLTPFDESSLSALVNADADALLGTEVEEHPRLAIDDADLLGQGTVNRSEPADGRVSPLASSTSHPSPFFSPPLSSSSSSSSSSLSAAASSSVEAEGTAEKDGSAGVSPALPSNEGRFDQRTWHAPPRTSVSSLAKKKKRRKARKERAERGHSSAVETGEGEDAAKLGKQSVAFLPHLVSRERLKSERSTYLDLATPTDISPPSPSSSFPSSLPSSLPLSPPPSSPSPSSASPSSPSSPSPSSSSSPASPSPSPSSPSSPSSPASPSPSSPSPSSSLGSFLSFWGEAEEADASSFSSLWARLLPSEKQSAETHREEGDTGLGGRGDTKETEETAETQRKSFGASPFGERRYGQLFSTFIAGYSYVTVVPCWANEMTADVRVERAIWISSAFCCVVYFFFGLLLAAAYPALNSDNVLQEMLRDPSTPLAARLAVYVFDLFTILPGILVYCIATRYNLVNSGFCTKHDAFWVGVVAPFAVSWLLMNDAYFSGLFTWSSLFFSLMCNFIAPIGVYILACKKLPPLQRNLQGKRGKVLFSPHLRRNVQGARDQATSADQVRRSLLQWLRSTLQEEAQTGEVDPQLLHLLLSPSTVPELDTPFAPALSGDALQPDLSPFDRDLLSDPLLSHPRCAWLHEEAATAAVAAAALQMRDGGLPTLAAYSKQPSAELRLRSVSPPSSEEGNRASLGSSPQATSRASSALLSGRTTPMSLWGETGSVAASRSASRSRGTPVSRLHACMRGRRAVSVQGRAEQRGETQDDLRNGAREDVCHETQAETGGAIRGGWNSEDRISPLSPLSQRPSLRRLSSQICTPPASRGPAARSTRDKHAGFSRASSPWSVRSPEGRAARDATGQRTLEEVDQLLRSHLVAQAKEAAAAQHGGEEAHFGIGSEASRTASSATFSQERSRKQSLASEMFWSPPHRNTRPTFSPLSERRESLERLSRDTSQELQTVSAPGPPRSRRPSTYFAHRVLRGTGSTLFRLLSEEGAKREASREEDAVVISGFPTLHPGPAALGSTGLARRVRELDEPEVAACVTRDIDDDAAAIRAQLELPKLLLQHADEVERNVWLMPFGDEDLEPRGRARRQPLSATGGARLEAGWSEEAERNSRRGRAPKASDGVRLRPQDGEGLRRAAGASAWGEADRRGSVGTSAAREGSGNSLRARASVAKKTRFPDDDSGALRAPEEPSDVPETYRERITVARTTETPTVGAGSSVPTQGPQVPRETQGSEETRELELFAPKKSQVSPASGAFEATSRAPGIGPSTPACRRGSEAPSPPPQETRESEMGDSGSWGVDSCLESPATSRETVLGSLQGPSSGVSSRGPSPQSRPRLRSARSHCVAPEAPSAAAVRRAQSCFLEAQSGGPPRPFAQCRLGREGEDLHASFLRGASWRDRVYPRGCLGRRGPRLASGPGTASLLLPQDNTVETLGIGKRGRDVLLHQQEQWIQQRLALLSHTSAPSPEGSLGLGSQGGSRSRVSPVSPVSLQRQSLSRSLSSPSPLSEFSEAFLAVEGLEAPLLLRQLKERRKAAVEAEKEWRKSSFAATHATFAAGPFLARGLTLGDLLGDVRGEASDRRDTVRDAVEGPALLKRSVSVHALAKPASSPGEGERRAFKRGFSARQICVKTSGRVERLAALFNRVTGVEKRETPVLREAATELEEGDSDGGEQTPRDSSAGRCGSRDESFLEGGRSSRVSSCSLFSSPRETVEDARDAEFSRSGVSPDSRADSSVSEDAFALPGVSSFPYPSSLFYSPRSSRTESSPAKALPSVFPLAPPFQDRASDSAASSAFSSCSSCSPGETREASHPTKDSEATVRGTLVDGDTLVSSPASYQNGWASPVEYEGPRRTAARQAGGQGALEPHGTQAVARGKTRWSGEETTREREGRLSPRVDSEARDVETPPGETLKSSEHERGETTVKFNVAETEKKETPSVVAPRDTRRLSILSPATSLSSRQVSPPRGSSEGPQGPTESLHAEPFSWDESFASVSAPAAAPPKASRRLYRALAGQDWQTKQAPLLAQCHREEANIMEGSEVEKREDEESGERVARPQSGNRVRYALETQGEASDEEPRPREAARSERMRMCVDDTKKPGETAEEPKPFVQRRRGKPKTLCVKAWGPARFKTDASDEAHEERDEDRDGPESDKREEGQDSKGSRDVYSSLPTIQVTFADDQEVSGYEDALAVDEDLLTGDLLPIKIHVYPTAFLRNIHIELSVLILTSLLLCAFASLLYQLVWGEGN